MFSPGEVLWFRNKSTNLIESVEVVDSNLSGFTFYYLGRLKKSTYAYATGKVYLDRKFIPPVIEKDCENCRLRKSGRCSELRNVLCDDYMPIPYADTALWPTWEEQRARRYHEIRSR